MDYPYAKFGDCIFSRFGFITDAANHLTHATVLRLFVVRKSIRCLLSKGETRRCLALGDCRLIVRHDTRRNGTRRNVMTEPAYGE